MKCSCENIPPIDMSCSPNIQGNILKLYFKTTDLKFNKDGTPIDGQQVMAYTDKRLKNEYGIVTLTK